MQLHSTAFLALLQCAAMIAGHLEPEVPNKCRRSIIEVPTFVGDRFDQRRSVVGYDGQCRRMFEEAADDDDDDDRSSTCCSSQPAVRLPPDRPENLRTNQEINHEPHYGSSDSGRVNKHECPSAINNDVWWLAVIENTNKNNEQLQQEIDTREAWRRFQYLRA